MRRITIGVLSEFLVAMSLGVWAQPPAAIITPQQVADALRTKNMPVTANQVTLPSHIPARISNPLLEVISITTIENSNTRVKLRCSVARDCLPFYAVIRGFQHGLLAKIASPSLTTPNGGPVPITTRDRWLVRRGERATLVLQGTRLRVELPVICLANAGAGTTIRVTTTDHKQFYRAQVEKRGSAEGRSVISCGQGNLLASPY